MTTYVLHGGKTSIDLPGNVEFYRHFTDLVDRELVHILMCYWARDRHEWSRKFEWDKSRVMQHSTKPAICSVVDNPADLIEKLPAADALYVAGGDAPPIEALLPKLSGLKEALAGKVYLGSSMGAFIVSTHYVLSLSDQDEDSVHHGLGLVPVNTLCHWNVEERRQMKLDMLKSIDPELPTLVLNEGQIAVLNI